MEENFNSLLSGDAVLIHNGFPNPAASKLDKALGLDLNQLLIKRPSSTYVFRISGHTYSDQGIYDGDLIIVDRGIPAKNSSLAVVWSQDSFRLVRFNSPELDEEPWGIVRSIIHSLRQD